MASFLRRIDRPRYMKEGIIRGEAFLNRAGEDELSYTLYKGDDAQVRFSLDQYQRNNALPSGDLPGLVEITTEQFAAVGMAEPTPSPDQADSKYGHLHCVTPSIDDVTAERLAKILTPRGIRLLFVRH